MHRSGTSAFTGLLESLGVNLGDSLMAAKPDNPLGFFENTFVVDTNEEALSLLGSAWDLPFPFPDDWPHSLAQAGLDIRICDYLAQEITADQLYAFKDPRLSILLPLWQPCFAAAGIADHYAILVRNPLEIAQSLAARNGFTSNHSLALWLQYMLAAERHTRGRPRGFVDFEQLMATPDQCVEAMFRATGLAIPVTPGDGSAGAPIDAGMRHHDGAELLQADCPALVQRAYQLFSQIAARGDTTEQDQQDLDALAAEFEASQALLYSADITAQVMQRRALPDDLEQFLASPPWRLYRAYQAAVEALFPEGSGIRRQLQKIKSWFL